MLHSAQPHLEGMVAMVSSLGGGGELCLCFSAAPVPSPAFFARFLMTLSLKAKPSLVIISFQEISPVCPVWSITFVPKLPLWRRSFRWLFPCLSH